MQLETNACRCWMGALLSAILMSATGCQGLPTTRPPLVEQPSTGSVSVAPWLLPRQRLDLPQEGLSLQAAWSRAHASADELAPLVDLVNAELDNAPKEERPGISLVVLHRKQSRVAFPPRLLFSSPLSEMRLEPGDRVESIPLNYTPLSSLYFGPEQPTDKRHFRVTGPFVRGGGPPTEIEGEFRLEQLESGPGLPFAVDPGSDVLVVRRVVNGITWNFLTPPSDAADSSAYLRDLVREGDEFQFTRIELLPWAQQRVLPQANALVVVEQQPCRVRPQAKPAWLNNLFPRWTAADRPRWFEPLPAFAAP